MTDSKMRDLLGLYRSIEALECKSAELYASLLNTQKGTLPGKFSVEGRKLLVDVFGHRLEAAPRVIRAPYGEFSVEFVFRAPALQLNEVWRFYLNLDGSLTLNEDRHGSPTPVSHLGNEYTWKHLLERLFDAVLRSALFSPTPPP
ncbi:hypothetical protein [Pseudoduganella sp. OTU4001]|uniref:hypothetical protein n=1 Tax=Pseudoduganella sp. OTU4001 TaxID=3043854 RepID=UPI00313E8920